MQIRASAKAALGIFYLGGAEADGDGGSCRRLRASPPIAALVMTPVDVGSRVATNGGQPENNY